MPRPCGVVQPEMFVSIATRSVPYTRWLVGLPLAPMTGMRIHPPSSFCLGLVSNLMYVAPTSTPTSLASFSSARLITAASAFAGLGLRLFSTR